MTQQKTILIIGGGAAGIFAANICAEKSPHAKIIVLEKTRQLLSKVRISGGGRCNVTHAAFDPKTLIHNYPRGSKELLGPFHTFQPKDTIRWFEEHGVTLKTEEDGRMFPVTDSSETIIHALLSAAQEKGVEIRSESNVSSIIQREDGFLVHFGKDQEIACDFLILATGSSPLGHALARALGHTIISPVPSLFTFNTPQSTLLPLAGITVADAELSLVGTTFRQRGNLLLTHWGFSGPCALKLSAWAARHLYDCHYHAQLSINWIPDQEKNRALDTLLALKKEKPLKKLENENPFQIPSNLWKNFIHRAEIPYTVSLGHLSNQKLQNLLTILFSDTYEIEGKTTFKQEFVTCGGIYLKEVDFKTLESRIVKNLYFAGEVLDIDAVTGGFNFQNAWTSAFLAATAIAER